MSSFQSHLVLSHFNRNPVDSDRKQNHCNISVPVLFHCLLCMRIHSSVLGHPSNVPPDPAHPWAPEVITCCYSIPLPPPTLLYRVSTADIIKILEWFRACFWSFVRSIFFKNCVYIIHASIAIMVRVAGGGLDPVPNANAFEDERRDECDLRCG